MIRDNVISRLEKSSLVSKFVNLKKSIVWCVIFVINCKSFSASFKHSSIVPSTMKWFSYLFYIFQVVSDGSRISEALSLISVFSSKPQDFKHQIVQELSRINYSSLIFMVTNVKGFPLYVYILSRRHTIYSNAPVRRQEGCSCFLKVIP